MKATTVNTRSKGGRPRGEVVKLCRQRYTNIIDNYHFMPADPIVAELLGCSLSTVRRVRIDLGNQYIFEGVENSPAFKVTPIPQPEPELTMMEKINLALTKLSEDDLKTLADILDSNA